jgi:hypothetical protein
VPKIKNYGRVMYGTGWFLAEEFFDYGIPKLGINCIFSALSEC